KSNFACENDSSGRRLTKTLERNSGECDEEGWKEAVNGSGYSFTSIKKKPGTDPLRFSSTTKSAKYESN
ncbi:hypothetical protein, partial [Staphylococcus aureus]